MVCDFGGSFSLDGEVGYCSDITRTVVTGDPTAQVAECYEVLLASQQAAVAAARDGIAAEAVDAVARSIIDDAGYGDLFIHRTGHGIGIEEQRCPSSLAFCCHVGILVHKELHNCLVPVPYRKVQRRPSVLVS